MKINKIDLYFFRQFFVTFFFILLLLILVILVIDFAEKMDDFLKNNVPRNVIINDYYLNFIPFYANLLSPICVFLAAIFFTAKLANNSEIVAILAGGVNFYRLLVPYLVAAAIFCGLSFYLSAYLVPITVEKRVDFELNWLNKKYDDGNRNMHIRVDVDSYAWVYAFVPWDSTGSHLFLERFDAQGRLTYRVSAKTMRFQERLSKSGSLSKWHLEGVKKTYYNDKTLTETKIQELDTVLNLLPDQIKPRKNWSETLTLPALNELIAEEKRKQSPLVDEYLLAKHQRFAYPFASFVLTLIGFALASRKSRGGIAKQIGLGLVITFLYVFILQIANVTLSAFFPPWFTIWVPNILFTLFGCLLLFKAQK